MRCEPTTPNTHYCGVDRHARSLFVHAVEVAQHFETQFIFVAPVLVNRRLAYARSLGDGIHARRIDATLGKQVERGIQYLPMSSNTSRSRHSYN